VTRLGGVVAFLMEGGPHEASAGFLGIPALVWQTANFVLFIVLAYVLLKKPAISFFGGRRAEVANSIRKAAEDRQRAEAVAREIAERLSRVEGELEEIRASARREAVLEQAALSKQAVEDAARIVARTSAEMENRLRAARTELTGFAADLAVEIARDVLKKTVTPEDEARLTKEGVKQLSGSKA
jgi:F-type H+-transporting ATPase subunit b